MRRLVVILLLVGACGDRRFREDQVLGGKTVSADTLERGRIAYTRYCRACHGDDGDGNGPAARFLRPPPRSFVGVGKKHRFKVKFSSVNVDKELPPDEDLDHVIRLGLHGTAMIAWQIPDDERAAIIEYLKTFSPSWQDGAQGTPMVIPPDPWTDDAQAIEVGKRLYHTEAACKDCHPSYATAAEMLAWTDGARREPRASSHVPGDPKQSDYGYAILPPDFLTQPMRAVHDDAEVEAITGRADPGHARRDLYRTIAAGIGGTAMPAQRTVRFKSFPDDTDRALWAIVHYVDWLRRLRDPGDDPTLQAARRALDDSLVQ